MKLNGRLILFTIALIAVATTCKFFFGPQIEWSGFSPVIAIALFSGFIIKQKDMSFLLPLLALFISDAAIQVLYYLTIRVSMPVNGNIMLYCCYPLLLAGC